MLIPRLDVYMLRQREFLGNEEGSLPGRPTNRQKYGLSALYHAGRKVEVCQL